jgi:hypothetical protein
MVQSRIERSVYPCEEAVDEHGCSFHQVLHHAQRVGVRVRGLFDLCKRTAKRLRKKDTCCVIKQMRNQPQGKRSLLPHGCGRGRCHALSRPMRASASWSKGHALRHGMAHVHTHGLHVLQKKRPLSVGKQTPLCRDSVTKAAVASLTRTGWRVDTSTQGQGGE